MKKSSSWLKTLSIKLFIGVFLLSCNSGNKIKVIYKYDNKNRVIYADYFNVSSSDYLVIIPKNIFADPYFNNRKIIGIDGLYYRKTANLIEEHKKEDTYSYIDGEFSDFYKLISLDKESKKTLKYKFHEGFDNDRYKEYKIYLVGKDDYNSDLFSKKHENFKKIKYENYLPYKYEVIYSGDTIIDVSR